MSSVLPEAAGHHLPPISIEPTSVDLRLRDRCALPEEVEVTALVRLRDVLQVQRAVAAGELGGGLLPVRPPLLELLVADVQGEAAALDVQLDQGAVANERERP